MRFQSDSAAVTVTATVVATLVMGIAVAVGAAPQHHEMPNMSARFMADSSRSAIEIGLSAGIGYMPARIRAGNMTFFYDPEHPENASGTVMLDARTISTGQEQFDQALKSADWLDVGNHSHILFHSSGVERTDDGDYLLGDLTIKGHTRSVKLKIDSVTDVLRDPQSKLDMVHFKGHTVLHRKDFELGMAPMWNQAVIGDLLMAGDEIRIDMHITGFSFNDEYLTQMFRKNVDDGTLHPVARIFDAVAEHGTEAGTDLFAELKAEYPDSVNNTTLSDAAWYLMLSGYHDAAVVIFDASIAEAPDYAMTYLRQGDAYVFAGQPDKAIENYSRMWEHYPTLPHIPEMLRLLGVENPTGRR